jgi:hypothetical protein
MSCSSRDNKELSTGVNPVAGLGADANGGGPACAAPVSGSCGVCGFCSTGSAGKLDC